MSDQVSKPIADQVQSGHMTPVEGLAALIVQCGNDTPELRPDPRDAEFIFSAGRILARLLTDAHLSPLNIGLSLAQAGIRAGSVLLARAPKGGTP